MDFIEMLLGRDDRRDEIDNIFELFGRLGRMIFTCGCIVVLVIVGAVVALTSGLISISNDQLTVAIVFITIIVSVLSLIRASLGY